MGIKMEQNESVVLDKYLEADRVGSLGDSLDGSQGKRTRPRENS